MKTLNLYTTLGCHLCEEAEALMRSALDKKSYTLEKIEISESEELVDKYGIRIPVIQLPSHIDPSTGEAAELGWPFDAQQFEQFLP